MNETFKSNIYLLGIFSLIILTRYLAGWHSAVPNVDTTCLRAVPSSCTFAKP